MTVVRVQVLPKYADFETLLDYQLPSGLEVRPGYLLSVPLGNRRVEALAVELMAESPFPNLKPVAAVLDDSCPLSKAQVELAYWLSARAASPLAGVLQVMLPPKGAGELETRWHLAQGFEDGSNLTEKQGKVAEYMQGRRAMLQSEIATALNISTAPIKALIKKEILKPIQEIPAFLEWEEDGVAELTADQVRVVEEARGHCLLHGVTGSGKTEVYIRLARRTLAAGKQVLVLVPEIALTAQLLARFRMAFGTDVAILHSGLRNSVRREYWRRIADGPARIVIGTRSAVFAPLRKLGLVVMDEEHEPSYKQEETPRYHARDVAVYLARQFGADLVLGSATPSLESWQAVARGHLKLLDLPRRIFDVRPVSYSLVDMRKELGLGNRSIFSLELKTALGEVLARGEQAILFLNRRGLAPTVLCRRCGFRFGCGGCSTTLTLHRDKTLRCHHCGFKRELPVVCPQCRGHFLRELGLGTQRLEQELLKGFPGCKVLRLDRDTAASAQNREQALVSFHRREADILVGTQMVAKGLDFPHVTLVGVMLADLSLAVADFRAAERTFQLVTQAAGRTGRGGRLGRVVIQSYNPEHYSLQYALKGDYQGFARRELALRQVGKMPPFASLSRVVVSSIVAPPEKELQRVVADLTELKEFDIISWGPAPMERHKGRYRLHVLISHNGSHQVREKLNVLRQEWTKLGDVRVTLDNDPYNFM
jgi:primosomal protein N' (replication factor Y)